MNFSSSAANSYIRDPSLDSKPPAKRKEPMPVDPNEDMDDEFDNDPRPVKRRRWADLESGIAHLSLDQSATLPTDDARLATSSASARDITDEPRVGPWLTGSGVSMTSLGSDRQNIILPGSVEEPSIAPEVQMKASSSYESNPNRVVVTDLGSYAEDEEEGDGVTVEDVDTPSGLQVNPAVLEHLRSSRIPTLDRSMHNIVPSDDSRALVLYQPLIPFARSRDPSPHPDNEITPEPLAQPLPETEDAMDLDV